MQKAGAGGIFLAQEALPASDLERYEDLELIRGKTNANIHRFNTN
jgi:hypothetical protein